MFPFRSPHGLSKWKLPFPAYCLSSSHHNWLIMSTWPEWGWSWAILFWPQNCFSLEILSLNRWPGSFGFFPSTPIAKFGVKRPFPFGGQSCEDVSPEIAGSSLPPSTQKAVGQIEKNEAELMVFESPVWIFQQFCRSWELPFDGFLIFYNQKCMANHVDRVHLL